MEQVTKISVITTFYNAETYLRQAIESVFNQEYTNWELILWDDGSTDNSASIAKEFLVREPAKVILGKNEINEGRGESLYKAIETSSGSHFCILDADDFLGKKALALVNNSFSQNPRANWLYTNYDEIDEKGVKIKSGIKTNTTYTRLNELHTLCCFHLRAIKRSFYEQSLKVDRNLTAAVDHDLNLKLSEQGKPIHVKRAVYKYRIHENRISVQKRTEQGKAFIDCSLAAIKRRGWEGKYYLSHTDDYSSTQLCERKYLREPLPQKVFCIGLGRTGTRSITKAIEKLGYNAVKNPRNLEVIEYFDVASDVLIAANYQQLDATYPNSKFILTVRDIPSWLDSWERHNARSLERFNNDLPQWVKDFRVMLYGRWEFDRETWEIKFSAHRKEVVDYFSQTNKLLIFNVFQNDGWRKLINFLPNVRSLTSEEKRNEITSKPFPSIKN